MPVDSVMPKTVNKKSESIDSDFYTGGTPSGTRTLDTLIKSQVLYQLS